MKTITNRSKNTRTLMRETKRQKKMKLVFERNGKLIETSDKSGLSAQGREILETMEENGESGWVEYNYYLVSDETETE